MSKHLERDLNNLKNEILHLGSLVESAINNAVLSLTSRRPELADKVLEKSSEIDELEVQIEEECLKILALHQPVAVDLRFLVVVLKVNNDLERMGDLAENLSNRALFLSSQPPLPMSDDFAVKLPDLIRQMVRKSLDSLVKLNVDTAREVISMDDSVDEINRSMYAEMQSIMKDDPSTVDRAVSALSCSRYLERVGDLSTNIAEDVVFMVEGEVIRHQEAP